MRHRSVQLLAILIALNLLFAGYGEADEITAADVIAKCRIRTNATDSRGHLDMSLKKISGEDLQNRRVFYFWKDYAGSGDLWSKSIVFVQYPPAEEDSGYLRFEYTLESGREPEQWLYTPNLQTVVRLAKRDSTQKSVGIVGDDLSVLLWNEGSQRLLSSKQGALGTSYVIEIVPKSTQLPYVKINSEYLVQDDDWDKCTRQRTEFFNKDGAVFKLITEDWAQQQQYWYRQRVQVKNLVTGTIADYKFHDFEFDVGFSDNYFTTRELPHAFRMINLRK